MSVVVQQVLITNGLKRGMVALYQVRVNGKIIDSRLRKEHALRAARQYGIPVDYRPCRLLDKRP